MPVLILVLLLTAPNEAEPSGGDSIERGARDALGQEARILVEPRAVLLSETEALALAQAAKASVVVEVRWADVAHRHAHLHMRTTDVPTWLDREIGFAREDDVADRDRTLGLAIGAMVTQTTVFAEPAHEEVPPVIAPAHAEPTKAPSASASSRPPVTLPSRAPAGDETNRAFSLSLEGMIAPALDANGVALGGGFVAGWSPSPAFRAHIEGVARTTSLGTPEGRVLTLGGGAGLTWYAYRFHAFAFGPRLDLLALRDDVAIVTGNATQHRSRWLSALDVLALAEWRPQSRLAFSLGLGADVSLGTGRIYVGDQRVATLAPLRVMAFAGVTVLF